MQQRTSRWIKYLICILLSGHAAFAFSQITVTADCSTSSMLCSSGTFSYTTGSGATQDFVYGSGSNPATNPAGYNSGCLLAGELNPMFMIINISSSGTLEWTFGNISGSTGCQDWIMWPYNSSTCAGIAAGTLPPVACNWNGACSGLTGMSSPVPPGGNSADFMNELNVVAGQQYLLCISNYSYQTGTAALTFTGTAGVACTVLPVELIDFYGSKEPYGNHLYWHTATEWNNDHFTLERSGDGQYYVFMKEVPGAVNSVTPNSYSHIDPEPLQGLNYYRLSQTDVNGSTEVVGVVVLENNTEGLVVGNIFPNPSEGTVSLPVSSATDQRLRVRVTDISGKTVYDQNTGVSAGLQNVVLPVASLAKGTYSVFVTGESGTTLGVQMLVKY